VEYSKPVKARLTSTRVNNNEVQQRVSALTAKDGQRNSEFVARIKKQAQSLNLPLLPTTTIGSFPQTQAIRKARRDYKAGTLSADAYHSQMEAEIRYAVEEQEALNLDVLVHGE
ncbi:5-methyltetrahydropteroyltriglutamate--homocysteine S-methyltransferase, partial [Pseudoalteromonas phenolica]